MIAAGGALSTAAVATETVYADYSNGHELGASTYRIGASWQFRHQPRTALSKTAGPRKLADMTTGPRCWVTGYAIACGLLCAGAALGGNSAELRLRSLAATCSACHGTDGNAARGWAVPRIAGLPRDYAIRQMHAFRGGTRSATVMQQIAKGYSDAQIESLADYFERRTAAP